MPTRAVTKLAADRFAESLHAVCLQPDMATEASAQPALTLVAASLLVISLIEATGVLCSLLTALTALCSAPVMLLAWLRACVSTVVLLQLAWLRNACSLAGGILAIVQLRHPADCQSAFPC